jgi:hypothetical protein
MKRKPLPAPWAAMAKAAGGICELARSLDVGRSSLWNWAHGKTEAQPRIQRAVNAWAERRGLRPPFKVSP